MNNGIKFKRINKSLVTPFDEMIYFFPSYSNKNLLKGVYNNETKLAMSLEETSNKQDLYVKFGELFEVMHFINNKPTPFYINKKPIYTLTCLKQTHLTYHGKGKNEKQSGEIHIKYEDYTPDLGKKPEIEFGTKDLLEAPLSSSSDISKFPIPICRIQLSENIESISTKNEILNSFQIKEENKFLNSIDISIAKKGFIKKCLNGKTDIPEVLISLFFYSNHLTFARGELGFDTELMPRVPGEGRIFVLEGKNLEVIIFHFMEYSNPTYSKNEIYYFHTNDYFNRIVMRNYIEEDDKFLVDLGFGEHRKFTFIKDHL